jgi:RNA polymerase sigma factor (sigma-70 family)
MFETDEELLRACRKGDARGWHNVLDRYERLLYSIPLNCGLTAEDAADIVQLTFTIFLQRLDDLDDGSNLSAWLATVARRHSWRRVAQRRREQLGYQADLAEKLDAGTDGEDQPVIVRWELLDWLNQGLNGLDPRCRELLVALYFAPDSPSYAEVAAQLGMAVGSVGPTRARCLEKLRNGLQEKKFTN